jgi:aminoglycoside phosphotransferase (APT) family kinase protein
MQEPILKSHWERFKAHFDLSLSTATMLLEPYTTDQIDEIKILSEGCANSNFKITFKNHKQPIVLRIYMREARALSVEIYIHTLVKDTIPLPKILYSNTQCQLIPYSYALMEWVDGELMRNVLLTGDENAISECAYEAGKYLSQLSKIVLPHSGFFDAHLNVRPFSPEEEYQKFIVTILNNDSVKSDLGNDLVRQIHELASTHGSLLSNDNTANLTHADYDPANILVKKIHGSWKISAILDWEFAFSGTYLLDMGIMLRYSHKLPACYEKQFIAGLTTSGIALHATWKQQCKLMDMLCLLQLIHYNPRATRPNLNKDVKSLIQYTLDHWNEWRES